MQQQPRSTAVPLHIGTAVSAQGSQSCCQRHGCMTVSYVLLSIAVITAIVGTSTFSVRLSIESDRDSTAAEQSAWKVCSYGVCVDTVTISGCSNFVSFTKAVRALEIIAILALAAAFVPAIVYHVGKIRRLFFVIAVCVVGVIAYLAAVFNFLYTWVISFCGVSGPIDASSSYIYIEGDRYYVTYIAGPGTIMWFLPGLFAFLSVLGVCNCCTRQPGQARNPGTYDARYAVPAGPPYCSGCGKPSAECRCSMKQDAVPQLQQ